MGLDSRNEFSNRTIRLCLMIISIRGEIKCSDIMTFRLAITFSFSLSLSLSLLKECYCDDLSTPYITVRRQRLEMLHKSGVFGIQNSFPTNWG
jgi:hypothetical protein